MTQIEQYKLQIEKATQLGTALNTLSAAYHKAIADGKTGSAKEIEKLLIQIIDKIMEL